MSSSDPLLVSVVVPTYKRPDLIERCLAALVRQTLPGYCYEIIVCDDGPDSATQQLVHTAIRQYRGKPSIRYIAVEASQGPAGARNAGWRQAKAKLIAFTDDDTIPESTWLRAGLDAMLEGVDAAAGRIVMPMPARPSDYEKDASRLQHAEFATASCFVLRSALEVIGGFDERFTLAWREDSDLHFSLLEQGCRIVSAPAAIVIHPLRPAQFGAGTGAQRKVMFDVLLYRKHPRLYRERIRRGPPWFYFLVSLSLIAGICGLLADHHTFAMGALVIWAGLSVAFFIWRLSRSSFSLRNIGELLVTSVLIPPLSIFWRTVGIARFGGRIP